MPRLRGSPWELLSLAHTDPTVRGLASSCAGIWTSPLAAGRRLSAVRLRGIADPRELSRLAAAEAVSERWAVNEAAARQPKVGVTVWRGRDPTGRRLGTPRPSLVLSSRGSGNSQNRQPRNPLPPPPQTQAPIQVGPGRRLPSLTLASTRKWVGSPRWTLSVTGAQDSSYLAKVSLVVRTPASVSRRAK